MKSILVITVLFSISALINAQVDLEGSYSYSGTLTEIDDGEFKYIAMDVPNNQCHLYNEDHSPYKSIDLSVPAGYYLNDLKFISRRVFNNDDNIEILYLYYKVDETNAQTVYTYGLKIVSENGTILLNLPDGGFAEIREGSNGPRLLCYKYIWNDSYYLVNTLVYTIGGTTKSALATSEQGLTLFPNPTEGILNIQLKDYPALTDSKVIISDISGRQISEQSISGKGERLIMNTETLPAGTYIVNLVNGEKIQASQKIIKK